VEVEATVERFGAPEVRFSLRSTELRLASLGVESDGKASGDALRNLSVDGVLATAGPKPEFRGTLRSAQGALQQTPYEDLQANLRLKNDVATLEKLSLKMGGGSYDGSGRYDMTNAEVPSFAFQSAVRGVALAPVLGPQFPGAAQMIEGRLDADLSLTGAGATWETRRRRPRRRRRRKAQGHQHRRGGARRRHRHSRRLGAGAGESAVALPGAVRRRGHDL
jgi:hypothetical protein